MHLLQIVCLTSVSHCHPPCDELFSTLHSYDSTILLSNRDLVLYKLCSQLELWIWDFGSGLLKYDIIIITIIIIIKIDITTFVIDVFSS